MSTKKQRMYQDIEKHGINLLAIFPKATINDPVKLCKKLLQLENKAHRLATQYCNGVIGAGEDDFTDLCKPILASVAEILNSDRVWLNGDARGYALKFDPLPGEVIYKDWGSNGIIAPTFTGDL